MDPAAIRPPRSTELRSRIRPATQAAVTTDLAPARTVTPAAATSQAGPAAANGTRNDPVGTTVAPFDAGGHSLLEAETRSEEADAEGRRSALLRQRAYARRQQDSSEPDRGTDLAL